ncbi:MAG: LPS translocon maturation chaperone LptM [Burkholderiaceae bacterium]
MKRTFILTTVACGLFVISACGQRGPLVLPPAPAPKASPTPPPAPAVKPQP